MSQFLLFRPVIAGQNFSFFCSQQATKKLTKMHQKLQSLCAFPKILRWGQSAKAGILKMSQFLLFRPIFLFKGEGFVHGTVKLLPTTTRSKMTPNFQNSDLRPIRGSYNTHNLSILLLSISNNGSTLSSFKKKMSKSRKLPKISKILSYDLSAAATTFKRSQFFFFRPPIMALPWALLKKKCSKVQNYPKFPKFRATTYPRQLRHSKCLNSSSFDLQRGWNRRL